MLADIQTDIRWMIRDDLSDVVDIEARCFEFPWDRKEFLRVLKIRNCIGLVLKDEDGIIGYAFYLLHRRQMEIINFAIYPEFQRRGHGSRLLQTLQRKLTESRTTLSCDVRETNLGAQLFLRKHLFRAISVQPNFYAETTEDSYRMIYRG